MPVTINGSGLTTGLDWGSLAGGLALIESKDVSGAGSVVFDTPFQASFRSYMVVFDGYGSNATDLRFRMRFDAADVSTASYHEQRFTVSGATVTGASATAQTSGLLGVIGTSSGRVEAWVSRPYEAQNTIVKSESSPSTATSSVSIVNSASGLADTASYVGFTVYPAAGSITGTVSVYGLIQSALSVYPPQFPVAPLDLYDYGNEFTSTTGGWITSTTSSGMTATRNASNLFMSFGDVNGTYGAWVTANKIDLTPYSRIYFTVTNNNTMENMRFGATSDTGGDSFVVGAHRQFTISNGVSTISGGLATYVKDISAVNTQYHLAFGGGGANYGNLGGSWQMNKMWLE